MKKLFTLVAVAMMAIGASADELIKEQSFDGGYEGDYPFGFVQFADGQEGGIASDPEGLAITVGTTTGELWQPQIQVMGDLTLDDESSYYVVCNAKFPCDGTLQINMGNWGGRDQYTTDVTATGEFQDVKVEFPDYAYVSDGNGFVLFQCGAFQGTTILKTVQVWRVGDATGIKDVKNKAQNGVRYNLAGQQVDANYKGAVIMNGKKFIQK